MFSFNFSTNSKETNAKQQKNIVPLQIRSGLRGGVYFKQLDPGIEDLNPGMAGSLEKHLLIKPMKY